MTVRSKAAIKAFVCAGDRPTETQFGDLIDSYQDRQSALDSFGSAAAQAFPAIIMVGASAPDTAVTAHHINTAARQAVSGAGTGFHVLSSAVGTAGLTNALGVGNVGSALFVANTTASAQNQLGGGTVGEQVFSAITTASALDHLSAAATTAQAANGTNVSAYMTPDNVRFNPFAARAYVNFTSAGSIRASQRTSSVTHETTGQFKIKWSPALPTANYSIGGMTGSKTAVNSAALVIHTDGSSVPTVSALDINIRDIQSDVATDPFGGASVVVFCSGA